MPFAPKTFAFYVTPAGPGGGDHDQINIVTKEALLKYASLELFEVGEMEEDHRYFQSAIWDEFDEMMQSLTKGTTIEHWGESMWTIVPRSYNSEEENTQHMADFLKKLRASPCMEEFFDDNLPDGDEQKYVEAEASAKANRDR